MYYLWSFTFYIAIQLYLFGVYARMSFGPPLYLPIRFIPHPVLPLPTLSVYIPFLPLVSSPPHVSSDFSIHRTPPHPPLPDSISSHSICLGSLPISLSQYSHPALRMHILIAHAQNGHISTSGLKSDVTIVPIPIFYFLFFLFFLFFLCFFLSPVYLYNS